MTFVLGIESSCDETSVAIVDEHKHIHANVVKTQLEQHAAYGGVVPEIAARSHVEWLEPVLGQALKDTALSMDDVDAIAVTSGPGLIGGVIVGVMSAKTLAAIYDKPIIGVNHLEGHALTPRLTSDVAFPYLMLLVSGGHFMYAVVEGVGKYHVLGTSIDDALGEAFDKCAKMMGLPYPGGPAIEKLALQGDAQAFDFPMPLKDKPGCDVSLSGLKTAIRYALRERADADGNLDEQVKADVAASFQRTVIDILLARSSNAMHMAAELGYTSLPFVITGGVAANQAIARAMQAFTAEHDVDLVVPPPALCTDNGAMIAWAGLERFTLGLIDDLLIEPRARWPLEELAS
ncbi:MAG: tRNA (adenosine(37)-N6)-threonylcarbamoyltransferase complex transferase subunit TsaD [Rickettsiales bacterium]|nr:tRNA (adenosine(37)-N6)-threonylcarbamoyltransferase complex transferase subunit TsaD [Rickettsiales bacterium]